MDKRIELLKNYCEFEVGKVYTLILLPRKKENKDQVEREKLNKRVRFLVSSIEDCEHAIDEFDRYGKLYPEIVFRIYVSVNRRSLMKGMQEFQKRMLDIQFDLLNGNDQAWTSVERLGSEWKSTLAKKKCRADRYFMYDIDLLNDVEDDIEKVNDFVEEIKTHTKIKYFGKSKNGFVLVVDPFNPNLIKLPKDIERKDDSYIYVSCMNG